MTREPFTDEERQAYQKALSRWRERAAAAVLRQTAPAKIEAALLKWIEKGKREIGRDPPLGFLLVFVAGQLQNADVDDAAACRLRAMVRFSDGVNKAALRVDNSYMDRLIAALPLSLDQDDEIDADVFRVGMAQDWEVDTLEVYHAAVLTHLAHVGFPTKRRRLLTEEESAQRVARFVAGDAAEFAKSIGATVFLRM